MINKVVNINLSASKTTFSHFNLKILRPKVTKNLKNLRKKFCESPPRAEGDNLSSLVNDTPFYVPCLP